MLENLNLVTMLLVVVVSGAFLALRGTCRAAGGETETSLEPRSLPSFAVRYGLAGIAAPQRTPAEIVDRLNREINAALVDPKVKVRLADLGGTVLALSPADYGKLNAAEIEKWAKVVKFANIKPE